MKRFESAIIYQGIYKTKGYQSKHYSTLSGFKKGLKANGCPYTVNSDGTINDKSSKNGLCLIKYSWNRYNNQITAEVEINKDEE